jgi:hypothetical protein
VSQKSLHLNSETSIVGPTVTLKTKIETITSSTSNTSTTNKSDRGNRSKSRSTSDNHDQKRQHKPYPFAVVVPAKDPHSKSERQRRSATTTRAAALLDWTHQKLETLTCSPDSYLCATHNDHDESNQTLNNDDSKANNVCCTAFNTEQLIHPRDYHDDDDDENDILEDTPSDIPTASAIAAAISSSLYRRTMTTAALANNNGGSTTTPTAADPQQHFKKAANMARGLADDASKAIGSLLPTASLQNITTRKYTLPDKTVASQVLMYRQLLHTACRPGLKLSRPYQGTAAQKAVLHMPWWEKGIEETQKMVISYDNLVTRLWIHGAIAPHTKKPSAVEPSSPPNLLDFGIEDTAAASDFDIDSKEPENLLDDKGLPPVPHPYWVDRLGFQQNDPVTDFRSGGVLSLAMMVYMVESCPAVCERFFSGDASVLPFGITCINVTDMMAKFLMLTKSTDRMDALLSQKPFWRMFADPNAIIALQELSMTMLCDVVVELRRERQTPGLDKTKHDVDSRHDTSDGKVRSTTTTSSS